MKEIILTVAALTWFATVYAQRSAESFVSEIPSVDNVCGMKMKDKDRVMTEIREFSDRIKKEVQERKKGQDVREETYRKQAEQHMADQYGLSQADIQRMKNSENMSQAEQDRMAREMANKMMMNTSGISMDEIDSFKDDTTGMTAWAQGYSTQKMAEQSVDPEKTKKEQMHAMSMFDLANAQKNLMDSLYAIETKYGKMFNELDQDSSGNQTLREIDSLTKKLYDMMGVDYGQGGEMEAILSSIKSKCLSYCNKFSSEYNEILTDYRRYVVSSIPAWKRLQVLTERMTEMQTGVMLQEAPGTLAIETIDRLVDRFLSMDKYYLKSPFINLDGTED